MTGADLAILRMPAAVLPAGALGLVQRADAVLGEYLPIARADLTPNTHSDRTRGRTLLRLIQDHSLTVEQFVGGVWLSIGSGDWMPDLDAGLDLTTTAGGKQNLTLDLQHLTPTDRGMVTLRARALLGVPAPAWLTRGPHGEHLQRVLEQLGVAQ